MNLVGIQQREGEGRRQEAKQFAVMGIIITELLREFATTIGNDRALVKSAGRVLDFCLTEQGAALVKGVAMDPFMLLPLRVMQTHAEESLRNLVNKRLPYFRRQLESTLEKAPVEQAQKICRDLQQMEAELGTQNRAGEFGAGSGARATNTALAFRVERQRGR